MANENPESVHVQSILGMKLANALSQKFDSSRFICSPSLYPLPKTIIAQDPPLYQERKSNISSSQYKLENDIARSELIKNNNENEQYRTDDDDDDMDESVTSFNTLSNEFEKYFMQPIDHIYTRKQLNHRVKTIAGSNPPKSSQQTLLDLDDIILPMNKLFRTKECFNESPDPFIDDHPHSCVLERSVILSSPQPQMESILSTSSDYLTKITSTYSQTTNFVANTITNSNSNHPKVNLNLSQHEYIPLVHKRRLCINGKNKGIDNYILTVTYSMKEDGTSIMDKDIFGPSMVIMHLREDSKRDDPVPEECNAPSTQSQELATQVDCFKYLETVYQMYFDQGSLCHGYQVKKKAIPPFIV